MRATPVVTGVGLVCPAGASAREALAAFRGEGPAVFRIDAGFAARLNPNQIRRLDRLSQLLLCACLEAAEQADWKELRGDRTGVVIGTGLGCLEKTESYLLGIARKGPAYADAMGFPDSMDSSPAAHVAMTLDCLGPSLTVTQREISGEAALILADLLLRRWALDAVMVAAGDVRCGVLEHALGRLAPGLNPGEAAAAVVLESEASAMRRGAPILGSLLGHGIFGDPAATSPLKLAPTDDLSRARDLALAMAGISPALLEDAPVIAPEDVTDRIGWFMADGVLRAILVLDRLAAGGGAVALVERRARGGAAASMIFGDGR